MNPSDENVMGRGLNEFSQNLAKLRDETVALWKSNLKTNRRAAGIQHELLIDAFPIIFDDLVQALTPGYPRALATSGTNLAEAHGAEHANNSTYSASDLVDELQKFRSAILSVAHLHGILFNFTQMEVVQNSFDKLIIDSVSSFSQKNSKDNDYFIATFTHDLRNPIHTASASAQLIKLQTNKATIVKLSQQISFSMKEAGTMIDDVLDAITLHKRKKLSLDITNFDIENLVIEVVKEANLTSSVVLYQTTPLSGFWCRSLLKRALTNLLSNAQKYSLKETPITVNLGKFEERMIISVHSYGTSIPSDAVGRIFQSLERLSDSKTVGWGIGLPMVKLVAESHGGVALVDSDAIRGTTFSINLPLDSRPFNKLT